ncbi:MAG: PAS domain-containing protein [Anaerolineae bacterium]|nr:PAS domain-containing protein [Anaerolineae bacterium]
MLPLKEFANFVTLDMANLSAIYAQLLADDNEEYSSISYNERSALARRILNAVTDCCLSQSSAPLLKIFDAEDDMNNTTHRLNTASVKNALYEVECLGQTLTPVVTSLEAGKFFWQLLADLRAVIIKSLAVSTSPQNAINKQDTTRLKITEPDVIDLALKTSLQENDTLSVAISNAAIGVVITDPHLPDNPLIYVNPAFTKITGYSADESIGQNCRFLQGPDTDALSISTIRKAVENERSCSVVILNYRKDSTPFWNELTINPVFSEDGSLLNFIGIQTDVTARQHAEDALLRRALELETVTEVSIATSTILDVNQLLQEVVDLTKTRFNLYHVHIYMFDEKAGDLNLTAGAGEVGRTMMKQGWQIPIDREDSLVARAARTRQAVIIDDVRKEPGFLPNPLLPNTRSEMTVPMIVGDKFLGVLDVQSDQVRHFTKDIAKIKITLASQIAVALQNAIQYQETQKALMEMGNSQDLLRTVIDATPDWIFIKDREHRYRLVNKGYSDSLNIPIDALIGKNDLDVGFPEDIVTGNPEKGIIGFWSDDDEIFATGQIKFIDVEPVELDGKRMYFSTVKAPVRDADGYIWGVLGYARNVTDREQLLAQVQMRAHREQTIREITEKMRSATTLEQLVKVTAEELGQSFSADYVMLNLNRDPSSEPVNNSG